MPSYIHTAEITITVTDSMGYESEGTYDVNRYYVENPGCVLGKWSERMGRHGYELTVTATGEVSAEILSALPKLTPLTPPLARVELDPPTYDTPFTASDTPPTEAECSALTVHKAAKALLSGELAVDAALAIYSGFTTRFGSFRQAFGKHGALHDTALAQKREAAFLLSLENQHGKPSALFSAPVARTRKRSTSLSDALLCVLDECGQIDLEAIATRLDATPEAVRDGLLSQGLAFDIPPWTPGAPGATMLSAVEYLTGDVGSKLRIAQAAAMHDPRFQRNVEALTRALPEPLPPEDITVGLGADWVPAEVFRDWLYSLFPGETWGLTVEKTQNKWAINCSNPSLARSLDLLRSAINNVMPVVNDTIGSADGVREVRNEAATLEAQARVLELRQRFESWVFSDVRGKSGETGKQRADRLCAIYNERFNTIAPRDLSGDHLTFNGLATVIGAKHYALKPRQLRGVAKILAGGTYDKSSYLVYPPGFGKTDPAIAGAVKLNQLGLVGRTLFAVPKSSLDQWHHRFLAMFPRLADQVLCASDHLFGVRGDGREVFLARIATGGWPFILITHEMLREILLSEAAFDSILAEEIAELRDCMREAESSVSKDATKQARRSLRSRETALDRISVAHKKRWATLREASRAPVTWEDCKVDHLVLDEAHAFKNLGIATRMERVAGLPTGEGSSRAYDCFIKCKTMFRAGGRVTALSGTPLTNTIAECFVWLRILQPKLLAHVGLTTFDAFASVFAEAYPSVEMDCVGKYRTQTRLRFRNVPELLSLLSEAWDFVREE